MTERCRITVQGIVQGVGFRPFVYGLAHAHQLAGVVRNDVRGVTIEVEGDSAAIQAFAAILQSQPPPLATIDQLTLEAVATRGEAGFAIEPSRKGNAKQALVSPDAGVCPDCLRELFDRTTGATAIPSSAARTAGRASP